MTSNMINEESNIFELEEKYMIKRINIKLAKKIGLDDTEAYRLTNWAKINNKYYYIKQSRGLNEMLGELIANELNLKTVHYEPIKRDNNLLFMSPNFREKEKKYNKVSDYVKEDLLNELREDILKLYALDIYMKQMDRGDSNILLEEKNNNITLAPIYDYEAAYMCSNKYYKEYYNYIYTIRFNEIDKVFNKYPELENNLKILLKIDFLKKLKQETEKYKLTFTNTINEFYEKSFEESHKMINKMIKG